MVIVAVPGIIVGIGVILALLLYLNRQAAQQLVEAIVETLRAVPVIGGLLARATAWLAERAAHYVARLFGLAAHATLDPLVSFFDSLAATVSDYFHSVGDLAQATAHSFDVLITSTIPAQIRAGTDYIGGKAFDAYRIGTFATRLAGTGLARVEGEIGALGREVAGLDRAVRGALATALGATLAPGLQWTEREIGRLTRELQDKLTRRMRAVAGAVAAGVLTGVVIRAIARHLPWARCTNVGKAGRALCRMDTDWLDALLLGLTAVLGSISIVEFAKETQAVTDVAEGAIKFFVRELHTLESADEINRDAFLAIYEA